MCRISVSRSSEGNHLVLLHALAKFLAIMQDGNLPAFGAEIRCNISTYHTTLSNVSSAVYNS